MATDHINIFFYMEFANREIDELLQNVTEPDKQETLVRYIITRFLYRDNLQANIIKYSPTEELTNIRLSILTILCDSEYLNGWAPE